MRISDWSSDVCSSDLFRAVVRDAVAPNIEAIRQSVLATPLPFADLVRMLLPQVAAIITTVPLGAVLKMVVGESRNFPELAKVWHDDVRSDERRVGKECVSTVRSRWAT